MLGNEHVAVKKLSVIRTAAPRRKKPSTQS